MSNVVGHHKTYHCERLWKEIDGEDRGDDELGVVVVVEENL